ncbi:hypothetical protein GQ44DRAFT_777616 [Phaeosphaeriaceae sp. PMI808]|nr:hypothetical protein GQ44DRAFT_777616 [Phaeosphaeriaceae sp. PMI808]
MRLLRIEDGGDFSLVERVGNNIPRYAILSHTWGRDEEEVTFKDLENGTGKTKVGYHKIRFCEKQAAKDELRYFWVDTCCIDKSSSAELSEAINSMFRWYKDAARCYVYLSDMSISDFAKNDLSFQKSRWFTRGWTLQELLAPNSVEFFSLEGERIGDKNSMVQEIHDITGISIQALQGAPLSQFSVDERMSWAERRKTKRDEDATYSMLGIFDIHMPLLYGEGRKKAFGRLWKEIKESSRDEPLMSSRSLATRVAETEMVRELCKYHIPFSLKGVPVAKFADRPQDTEALERALLPQKQDRRRRMLVLHGLGGMGKTQLAADFARRHQRSFLSVLWLDGSGESNLKQSIAACASRIPVGQVTESSRMYASSRGGDLDAVVEDVLCWLSMPDNGDWLVVVDNVDRDHRRREEDAEAYDVEEYLPEADQGSVLITTRLPHLAQLGERWEVKKVDEERALAIFETWYGRGVGQEGDELLGLLDGLPLALAQAAAYMSETGTSFSTYTRLYKEQWRELMEPYDGRHMPLRSYANGSVATTWMISYRAVRARSEAAANLLLLWAHLDNKSLWHGLLAAASRESAIAAERTSAWLGEIARSEVEFIKAIGMLRSYSLVEEMEDQTGYAMHLVVHQWALHIQDDSQRAALSWVATIAVGLAVPMSDTMKYWETQLRLLPHAERCKKRFKEAMKNQFGERELDGQKEEKEILLWAVHCLANLYANQGKMNEAEKMYVWALEGFEKALGAKHTSTLQIVNNLGNLYKDQGKLDEAEKMYVWALEGFEKALGAKHTSTLQTVNNLGILYANQGKLDEAENMYMRALEGKEKALGVEHTSTLQTVNNLGNLYKDRGKLDEAKKMFIRALEGKEKALGIEHTSTLQTVNNLGNLYAEWRKLEEAEEMYMWALGGYKNALGAEHTSTLQIVNNLGNLYKDWGKLDEAEKMYMRALQIYKSTCNLDHASARNALSSLYKIYQQHFVSLRQEQSAYHWANPVNPGRAQYNKHIVIAVANLCEEMGIVWPFFFSILGRMLVWAGRDDDAVLAFQHQSCLIESKPEQGGTICDGCNNWLHAGMARFVCRACVEIDLCEGCYKEYEMDGFIPRGSAENCQAHPFLAVPGETRKLHSGTSPSDVSLAQWFTTIRIQH